MMESAPNYSLDNSSPNDWYRNLLTGKVEWLEGSFYIGGYEHLSFNFTESSTDINNITTTIRYDGSTKSSYIYNPSNASFEFLKNYENSSAITNFLMGYINGGLNIGQTAGEALVVGFQAGGFALYKGVTEGEDLDGFKFSRYNFQPVFDMESTLQYNNGKWVNVNTMSNGTLGYGLYYAKSIQKTNSFFNIPKNLKKAGEILKKL